MNTGNVGAVRADMGRWKEGRKGRGDQRRGWATEDCWSWRREGAVQRIEGGIERGK